MKQDHHFAVFDPHKRNSQGHVDARTGTAVVVYHSEYATLYDHLENLARQLLSDDHTLHAMPFEVRGVKVMITGNMMQHCEVPTARKDCQKQQCQPKPTRRQTTLQCCVER